MPLGFAAGNGQERGGFVSDARTGKRFPLELPIKIHKEEGGGEHSGLTGNLSAAGVYLKAGAALEMGSSVEYQITFPPEMPGAKDGGVIQGRGRGVRPDEPGGSNPTE